ncbi:MAG TPA: hypothetical protein VGQ39_26345 [Pyrinomonadaceae bacterium]|nr:hypothetical protein [Pyrinomonadaceae bacterium]
MQCGSARKHLYRAEHTTSEGPSHPVAAEVARAEEHLESCAACREFFAAEERLKTLLKLRAPREAASLALREQILSRLAEERRPAGASRLRRLIGSRRVAWALVAMLVIAVLAGGFWLRSRRSDIASHRLTSVLVDDHARYLSGETEVTSTDPEIVQAWFRGKVDFSFRLPKEGGLTLIGGRLCYLQNRRAALLLYGPAAQRVSLFILDGSDVDLPQERLVKLDERPCLVETKKGYNVVMWKERGLVYGMVSDMRSADLLQLSTRF